MKKILSLFLAVLMMFSVLSVGSYADDEDPGTSGTGTETEPGTESEAPAYTDDWHAAGALEADQVVLTFKIEGGTYTSGHYVYDMETSQFVYKTPEQMVNFEPYVMLPMDKFSQKPGSSVALPDVDGKTGYTFNGWYCDKDGTTYSAGYTGYRIPTAFYYGTDPTPIPTEGTVIDFQAVYRPAKVEEDTFAKVFDILAKIFGTIIGLIAYEGDTEAGIAFVKKVFSGISS